MVAAYADVLKESRQAQSVHSRVPVLQTVFTGREIEMNEMKEELGDPRQGRKGVVLWGLHGYGKTQLAIHYISVIRELYDSILWIDCSSWDAIHDSFSQIWRKIQGCVDDEQSPIEPVLEWLEQETNPAWIMVFDGVESPDTSTTKDIDIRKYFPSCNHGHVLLTTLSPYLHARLGFPGIRVRGVDEHAGVEILLRCAGVEEPDSPGKFTASDMRRILLTWVCSCGNSKGNFPQSWRSASCLGTSRILSTMWIIFLGRFQSAVSRRVCKVDFQYPAV